MFATSAEKHAGAGVGTMPRARRMTSRSSTYIVWVCHSKYSHMTSRAARPGRDVARSRLEVERLRVEVNQGGAVSVERGGGGGVSGA